MSVPIFFGKAAYICFIKLNNMLFCFLDKNFSDAQDVTVEHIHADSLEEAKITFLDEIFGIGDVDLTKKWVDIEAGSLRKEFVKEYEEECGVNTVSEYMDNVEITTVLF